jgi:hypothetical protein
VSFGNKSLRKLYKRNGREGKWITSGMCKVMLPDFSLALFFLWDLGDLARIMSGSLTL